MGTPTAEANADVSEPTARKARLMAALARHPFREAWWLRGANVQTAWAPLCRRQERPAFRHEPWTTPDDDTLNLHFLDGDPSQPTAVLLHGLEGSVESNYVVGLSRELARHRWNVVAMEFRTCGGEMNRARRLYHLGETTDLALVVNTLLERNSNARIFVAGVSLGGNVTAKWLGEMGDAAPTNVRAAAVISPPFDLLVSGPYMDRPLGLLYTRRFLNTLIPKALEKERQYPGTLDPDLVRRARTFEDFDTHATARIHGFRDAQDYWGQCSCGQFLHAIRRPTLVIAAENDPFNPASAIPRDILRESPYLFPQITPRGGHVGFIAGSWPWSARYWAEEQVARFFLACAAE